MEKLLKTDAKKENLIKAVGALQLIALVLFFITVGILFYFEKHDVVNTVRLTVLLVFWVNLTVIIMINTIYGDVLTRVTLGEHKKHMIYIMDNRLFIESIGVPGIYEITKIDMYKEVNEHGHKCIIMRFTKSSNGKEEESASYVEIVDIYTNDSVKQLREIVDNTYKVNVA